MFQSNEFFLINKFFLFWFMFERFLSWLPSNGYQTGDFTPRCYMNHHTIESSAKIDCWTIFLIKNRRVRIECVASRKFCDWSKSAGERNTAMKNDADIYFVSRDGRVTSSMKIFISRLIPYKIVSIIITFYTHFSYINAYIIPMNLTTNLQA